MPYSRDVRNVLKIILYLNLFVLLIKIFAGIATKSLGILGDAAHSTTDALNNIVGLLVLRVAGDPPDKEHPYGHGKFETLAAFAIVTFLAIACVELIQTSIHRLLHPVSLPLFKQEVIWLLVLTLFINIFVWIYERKKGEQFKSNLLIADSSHTGSDVLVTISVLASQLFVAKNILWADSAIALVIAFVIAKAGYEIITHTVPILVDQAWHDPKEIKKSVLEVEGVKDCYDIYSRETPYSAFVECKIQVVPKDLYTAHKIADKVEEKLKSDFGNCRVTIHIEP